MNGVLTARCALTSAIVMLTAPGGAHADVITPGFDYFTSNDANGDSLGSAVDLSAYGLGVVPLKGAEFKIHGFAADQFHIDTVVRRRQGIDPFDWPDGEGTIDIELVALHLVSVEPLDIGGTLVDLHTIVNRYGRVDSLPTTDGLRRSLGGMRIRHEDPEGGTFDSIFGAPGDEPNVPPELADLLVPRGGVTARAYLTVADEDPFYSGNWVMDPFDADRLIIWSLDSTWEHSQYTDFQVTSIKHDCGFPECHHVDRVIIPAVPGVMLLGVAGVMCVHRRHGSRRMIAHAPIARPGTVVR